MFEKSYPVSLLRSEGSILLLIDMQSLIFCTNTSSGIAYDLFDLLKRISYENTIYFWGRKVLACKLIQLVKKYQIYKPAYILLNFMLLV